MLALLNQRMAILAMEMTTLHAQGAAVRQGLSSGPPLTPGEPSDAREGWGFDADPRYRWWVRLTFPAGSGSSNREDGDGEVAVLQEERQTRP